MHKTPSGSTLGPGGLLAQAFFKPIHGSAPPSSSNRRTKISVIGADNVEMAIAQTILTQGLTDELTLVDAKADKLRNEMLDLQHAAAFLPRTKINASVHYAITAGSDLCIVTARARQIQGESRLNLLQRNVALFRHIIPLLTKYSSDTILLIVSNLVDVLTYIAWKLSGFPTNRVLGSGTNLDSSRFRFLIADHLDVNAQDVQRIANIFILTKFPNTIRRGDNPPLLGRDGRRQFQTDDDRALISQILDIDESHDDRPYDPTPISSKHILQAAETILSSVTKPDINSNVSGSAVPAGAHEDALEHHASPSSLHENYGVPTSLFITISGQLFAKWLTGEDDNKKKLAMDILYAVKQYDWHEKVVLVLGTFAVKKGEFWLVAQLYTTYAFAKEIGKLEQLPEILERSQTDLKPKFDAYNNLVKAVLKVTKSIVQLQELRRDPHLTTELESSTNSTDDHIRT